MPGEALLIGIATVAVVIAGFTGITSALTPAQGAWTTAQRIRQRAIVSTSFNVTFESLIPVIVFAALGDARESLVLASAGVAVYVSFIIGLRARQFGQAAALRSRGTLLMLSFSVGALLLFAANALVFGSVAVYAPALLLQLAVAALSFYSLISSASS